MQNLYRFGKTLLPFSVKNVHDVSYQDISLKISLLLCLNCRCFRNSCIFAADTTIVRS